MIHYEDAEQKALLEWAQLQPCVSAGGKIGAYLVHIPNGGKRDPREAARLKAMGVRAGVSDLLLALPRLGYHGLWVELKKQLRHFSKGEAKRAASDEQLDWIAQMQRHGYAACVCYGFDEASKLIAAYACGDRQAFHAVYDHALFRFRPNGLTS